MISCRRSPKQSLLWSYRAQYRVDEYWKLSSSQTWRSLKETGLSFPFFPELFKLLVKVHPRVIVYVLHRGFRAGSDSVETALDEQMLQIVLQGQRTATPAHLVKGEGPSTTALLPKVLLSICFRFRLEHAHTLSSQSLVWTFPKWQTPQSAALSLSLVAVISYRAGLVSWSFSLICIFMIFQLTFHTFRSSLVGQNAHLSALWMCCLPCNDEKTLLRSMDWT